MKMKMSFEGCAMNIQQHFEEIHFNLWNKSFGENFDVMVNGNKKGWGNTVRHSELIFLN